MEEEVKRFLSFFQDFKKRYVTPQKKGEGKYYEWIKKIIEARQTIDSDSYFEDIRGMGLQQKGIGNIALGEINNYVLVIDYTDIFSWDKELAIGVITQPKQYLKYAQTALKILYQQAEPKRSELVKSHLDIIPRFHNFQDPDNLKYANINRVKIRNIEPSDINKIIEVEGVVARIGFVKQEIIEEVFLCKQCREEFTMYFSNYIRSRPVICKNEQCRRKGPFISIEEKSKYIKYQKITIQEKHEESTVKDTRTLDVVLTRDLVDKVKGNNMVIVSGVLKAYGTKKADTILDIFLEANYIDAIEKDPIDEVLSPEDETYCKELAKDPNLYDRIIKSIAPAILGYPYIKEAIMYQLFEGSRKKMAGVWLRGIIHILLVGDPGVGKSQILQSIKDIAPICLYTTGRGSTAAGLTAAIIMDKASGHFMMEVGILPICDRGVACITGDSKVLFNNTYTKVENLFNENNKILARDKLGAIEICKINGCVVSINSDLQSNNSFTTLVRRKKHNSKVVKIFFDSGFEIKVTKDHKLLDGNSIIWKEAEYFKVGDFVISPLKILTNYKPIYIFDIIPDHWRIMINIEDKKELKKKVVSKYSTLSVFNRKYNISAHFLSGPEQINVGIFKKILREFDCYDEWRDKTFTYGRKASTEELKISKITPDLAYFLGFIYGDGSVSINKRRSNIQISQSLKNIKQIEQMKKCVSNFSNIELGEYHRKYESIINGKNVTSSGVVLYRNSNLLAYLYSYFIGGSLKNIFQLSDECVKAFVAGCMDSDGCISIKNGIKDNKNYKSVHVEFLLSNDIEECRTFVLLLRKFDCYSKIIRLKNVISIRTTGRVDIKNLLYAIKKYSVKYKDIPLRKSKIGATSDYIPIIPIKDICTKIMANNNIKDLQDSGIYSTLWSYIHKKRQPTREQLIKIKDYCFNSLDISTINYIEQITNRDFFLDKIIAIEEIEYNNYVYDLYVPNFHNFICNGIFVHNCIDEFDKMNPHDSSSIHEAMEQNRVSIAKAGQKYELNARTSILAAANPTYGKYDLDKSIAENLRKLAITIINRFDLIFIMKDIPNPENDAAIADHVLGLRSGKLKMDDLIPNDKLAKYIKYAKKNCDPNITSEVYQKLKDFYLLMRRKSKEKEEEYDKSPIAITVRQLEGLIRLAEARAKIQLRENVIIEDAEAAIKIMKTFLDQVAFDFETQSYDIGKLTIGQTENKQSRILSIPQFILDIGTEKKQISNKIVYATTDQILEKYNQTYSKNQVDKKTIELYLGDLYSKGIVFGQNEQWKVA